MQQRNKKVVNATINEFDGIVFKSLLERRAYQLFKEAELNPAYEVRKIPIMQGFKPTVPFYKPTKKTKILTLNKVKVKDITYTPDFIIQGRNSIYYIEIKGFATTGYDIKVKLFRLWLELNEPNSVFFELHTVRDIKETINIINKYERDRRPIDNST